MGDFYPGRVAEGDQESNQYPAAIIIYLRRRPKSNRLGRLLLYYEFKVNYLVLLLNPYPLVRPVVVQSFSFIGLR